MATRGRGETDTFWIADFGLRNEGRRAHSEKAWRKAGEGLEVRDQTTEERCYVRFS
jgi:hypothetical protein